MNFFEATDLHRALNLNFSMGSTHLKIISNER